MHFVRRASPPEFPLPRCFLDRTSSADAPCSPERQPLDTGRPAVSTAKGEATQASGLEHGSGAPDGRTAGTVMLSGLINLPAVLIVVVLKASLSH